MRVVHVYPDTVRNFGTVHPATELPRDLTVAEVNIEPDDDDVLTVTIIYEQRRRSASEVRAIEGYRMLAVRCREYLDLVTTAAGDSPDRLTSSHAHLLRRGIKAALDSISRHG